MGLAAARTTAKSFAKATGEPLRGFARRRNSFGSDLGRSMSSESCTIPHEDRYDVKPVDAKGRHSQSASSTQQAPPVLSSGTVPLEDPAHLLRPRTPPTGSEHQYQRPLSLRRRS